MKVDREKLYRIIDTLAHEYGWNIEYCMSLPTDVINGLYDAITKRQLEDLKIWAKVIAAGTGAGFSGDASNLDKLFNKDVKDKEEVIDPETWKNQVKAVWIQHGKDPEEFERKFENGEEIVF